MKIRITIGKLSMEAELNETPTSQKVAAALPLKCSFSTWGDEIYFTILVTAPLDSSAKEVVELGERRLQRVDRDVFGEQRVAGDAPRDGTGRAEVAAKQLAERGCLAGARSQHQRRVRHLLPGIAWWSIGHGASER